MKRTLLIGLLLSTHALGFNVTVRDNAGTSTNGSFVGDVWTPTADSILDRADLDIQPSRADTTIDTNGAGTIRIADSGIGSAGGDIESSAKLNIASNSGGIVL
jgi:hypothetical protein